MLTYTQNAEDDLRKRVLLRYGYMPSEVHISTYFSFLVRFCAKPLLHAVMKDRGITFDRPTDFSRNFRLEDDRRYFDGGRRLYHCRLAKLLMMRCMDELRRRVERYFDRVVVDEIQDFGGYDFNFLFDLSQARVDWYLVGDFHQHTFDTSRDGPTNKQLHADLAVYQRSFVRAGFKVDTSTLRGSCRCSREVCAFIREHLGIAIEPANSKSTQVEIVASRAAASELHRDPGVLKLFYQQHYLYSCHSMNWGASKGLDQYQDVCVVLNRSSWMSYQRGALAGSAPATRNKLYVASSRPHRHLYVLDESLIAPHKSKAARADCV
jgi:DNA helicase-2/ATP-dependent DNA helicase PcrA